jgi:hypothetical protein
MIGVPYLEAAPASLSAPWNYRCEVISVRWVAAGRELVLFDTGEPDGTRSKKVVTLGSRSSRVSFSSWSKDLNSRVRA